MRKIQVGDNPQRNTFQLTINNPLPDYDHTRIKDILIRNFKTVKYFCMADEISETGTPHTHIYIYFSSRVRWSTVKKYFPTAHIEHAFSSLRGNIDYIQKAGKWEGTEKANTKVEGTFEEWGEIPTQKGQRNDMEELYGMVKDGYTTSEILAYNHDYILQIDKIDKLRTTLLIEENKGKRRLDLKVIYIYGGTGKGKTRSVLDRHGDANVYRVTDYLHPFDHYECQEVIVFDEFRSEIKIANMLNYLDVYPVQLSARYVNRYACYNTVYIVTNWKLENQYKDVQRENKETWEAFLRRIHEVQIFNADGTIEKYKSVKEYLSREEKFKDVGLSEIPFAEGKEFSN